MTSKDKERNEFLEADGLFFESDTHEWFKSETNTRYLQKEDHNGVAMPNMYCFIIRDKATGEYDYVIFDNETREVVYSTKNLEALGTRIDMMKAAEYFKKHEEREEQDERTEKRIGLTNSLRNTRGSASCRWAKKNL